ncbi:MAG: hypothetical protein OEZ36_11880 [Spirochaetota bacterium]|nr:hypothetical protein [Spirochaetota bacterium]
MKTLYRIQLELISPIVTAVMGDTMFGHICWGIYYSKGEEVLNEFLQSYETDPPLILSDGFPEGFLAKPMLNPYLPTSLEYDDYKVNKKYGKRKYVENKLLIRDEFRFSEETLFDYWNKEKSSQEKIQKMISVSRIHNSINRISGTVEKGQLYEVTENYFPQNKETSKQDKVEKEKKANIMDLYVVSSFDEDKVKSLIQRGIEGGYGADKSTGKGQMELYDIKKITPPTKGNRYVALGAFVPENIETVQDLRANVATKYGKLGGHFASGKNPFKKPIIMYQAGASFRSEKDIQYIGTLLKGIHSDKRIRHYAYCPVIPYQEEENHD